MTYVYLHSYSVVFGGFWLYFCLYNLTINRTLVVECSFKILHLSDKMYKLFLSLICLLFTPYNTKIIIKI